ncbi:hypothetical protein B0H11DRAFT_1902436 [Mycena galericulata]|nr:hypothetical protein B0H11DRAFT_1902436 [Mycena galericulata]
MSYMRSLKTRDGKMCIDLEAWISAERYAVSVNVWAGNAKIMSATTGRHLEVWSVYPNQPLEEGPSVDCRFWMGKEKKKMETLTCNPWGEEEQAGIGNLTHQLRLSLLTQGVERSMLSFTTQGVERSLERCKGQARGREMGQAREHRKGQGRRAQEQESTRTLDEGSTTVREVAAMPQEGKSVRHGLGGVKRGIEVRQGKAWDERREREERDGRQSVR